MAGLAEEAGCTALTGAGGKTGLMAWIGDVLAGQGLEVVRTTSTRIYAPPDTLLLDDLPAAEAAAVIRRTLDSLPVGRKNITLGKKHAENGRKLLGLSADQICMLRACLPGVRFLVEADGAARLPLKAHAPYEPVIPGCADLTVAIAGLDALNKPWKDVVHRPERGLQLLAETGRPEQNLSLDRLVTAADMAFLLLHPAGPFRGAQHGKAILLNKVDCLKNESAARAVVAHIHAQYPDIPCYIGSVRQKRLVAF